jgi:hypothetical protein
MSNEFRDRMLSIGVISHRSKPRVSAEGRAHEESGLPFKSVTTDEGTVTEHGAQGAGVSQRQDVNVTPQAIKMKLVRM